MELGGSCQANNEMEYKFKDVTGTGAMKTVTSCMRKKGFEFVVGTFQMLSD